MATTTRKRASRAVTVAPVPRKGLKKSSRARASTAAPAKKRAAPKPARRAAVKAAPRVRIRMYRHGLGDCFLLRFAQSQGRDFSVLIDCGVILGTPDAKAQSARVLADVGKEVKNKLDVLVGTHGHWDHLSGFIQAPEEFANLSVGEVWLAWTEDPKNPLAKKLTKARSDAQMAVRAAGARLALHGAGSTATVVDNLLGFFGANGRSTQDAVDAVRDKSKNLHYWKPDDKPFEIPGTDVRVYALGPPPDETFLKRSHVSAKSDVFHLGALAAGADAMLDMLDAKSEPPFDRRFVIPQRVLESMDFFRSRYFQSSSNESYRRIDSSYLDAAGALALQLDAHTNNTSLVLAFEFGEGDVLLFAADAQIGNWESWQDVSWKVGKRKVTGPDLLGRTIVYKVGHHGSHNATLKEQGLNLMQSLQIALVPVDREMAKKRKWARMPLPGLCEALEERASLGVLYSDRPVPKRLKDRVDAPKEYFDFSI